jgi:hypothetical protein
VESNRSVISCTLPADPRVMSPLITRGSAGRAQLDTLLLLSTHHLWISWQSTAGHTSVNLHSSPVDQLAEYCWSHFCYSPLESNRSVTSCTLPADPQVMSGEQQKCDQLYSSPVDQFSWQSTAGHTFVTLHSSPVDQLAEYLWSHFCYSPLITRGSAY